MFDWSFRFLAHCSGEFYQVPLVFALCELIVSSFFRIAFQGRLRFRISTKLLGDKG